MLVGRSSRLHFRWRGRFLLLHCYCWWGRSLLLRRCGCESTCSPKGPRPADGFGVGAGPRSAGRVTQGSAFVREGAKDAALVSGSRRERSIVRVSAREGRTLRPPGRLVPRWAGILPSRGPFHDDGESLPLRGQIRRHDASFTRHGPHEGRIVRGSRTNEESWPRPADPTAPRPTAPVEALSEIDPPRSHSDAAARHDPPGAAQQQGTTHPEQRSSTRRPSHSGAAARTDPAT